MANLSPTRPPLRTALGGQSAAISATTSKKDGLRSGNIKHGENLTAMLVGVVTVFIICQLPGLGVRITNSVFDFDRESSSVIKLRYANIASNALLIFNSAVNIVIYCLIGKRFRRILLDELFGCRSTSANSPGTPTDFRMCDSHLTRV